MDLHRLYCNLNIILHAIHSIQKDGSGLLLLKDLLQFDSHKQPPPINDHKLFAFGWLLTEGLTVAL